MLVTRQISLVACLIVGMSLLGAVFIEHHYQLPLCTLCLLQRYVMGVIGLCYGLSLVFSTFRTRLLYAVTLLLSLIGAIIAAWQVWVQHQPKRLQSCMPEWTGLLKKGELGAVFKGLFRGDCTGLESFTILGGSLAFWGAIVFFFLAILAGFGLIAAQNKKGQLG